MTSTRHDWSRRARSSSSLPMINQRSTHMAEHGFKERVELLERNAFCSCESSLLSSWATFVRYPQHLAIQDALPESVVAQPPSKSSSSRPSPTSCHPFTHPPSLQQTDFLPRCRGGVAFLETPYRALVPRAPSNAHTLRSGPRHTHRWSHHRQTPHLPPPHLPHLRRLTSLTSRRLRRGARP